MKTHWKKALIGALACACIHLSADGCIHLYTRDGEEVDDDCWDEEECFEEEDPCCRRHLFHFEPYDPEEDYLIEEREEAHWPGKREGDLYEELSR